MNYAEYLQVDRLLDLQEPRSEPVEHDELLFIVIHQVYELWFKQMLWELDRVAGLFDSGDVFGAISSFKRIRTIMKTLVGQLDVLETMTPISFAAFRDRLETASGFQSAQFREVEFVLGYKRPEMIGHFEPGSAVHLRLEERLDAPSLVDHFYGFLEGHGVEIPAEVKDKDPRAPNVPNETVQEGILRLFREGREASILFELMLDLDEGLQEWRYRHVKMVERTIGNKGGTGGSMGVEFLKRSLFLSVFPDLWAIRKEF